MKKKLISFLLIAAVLCTLFAGCGEDKNPTGTTGGDVTQDTTELTDPIITTETDATIPGGQTITYTEFERMNGEQQKNVISKFESKEEFDEWYEEIKEDHKEYVETVKPSEIVNPKPTTESTEPEGTILPTPTGVTVPDKDELTFMDYHEMSGDEQLAFINSFSSYDAFAAWHAAARDAYNETMIEIDDTKPIDGSELINKIGDN